LNRTFLLFAMAGLAVAPMRSLAQDLPEELKEDALAVRVHASVPLAADPQGGKVAWQEESVKYTVPGVPVGVKLLGTNIVVLTHVTPFDRGDGKLTLVAQGQVWVRGPSGLSYRTTLETVSVAFGETVFFYPLGVSADGKAPLRIEISVNRSGKDAPAPSAEAGARNPPPPPDPSAAQGLPPPKVDSPSEAKPKR